jgi:hypothetical protein
MRDFQWRTWAMFSLVAAAPVARQVNCGDDGHAERARIARGLALSPVPLNLDDVSRTGGDEFSHPR